MDNLQQQLSTTFGNRIRVRVCGICFIDNSILLIRHDGMGPEQLWLPPGGGLAFGESTHEALIREFKEETGLDILVERFLFMYEILRPPFHSIELFFCVKPINGQIQLGYDPELSEQQTLSDLQWVGFDTIKKWPQQWKHHLFHYCHDPKSLLTMTGYYRYIENDKHSGNLKGTGVDIDTTS